MTVQQTRELPKLLAPREDLGLLVWPEPRQLLRETWDNHRYLRGCGEARLLGVPLFQLRRWMRRWIGHSDDARPIIATGHQTELHHPGVWVKDAVIDVAANRIGAQAIHFAVDTDAPKHLVYRWPGGGRPITDDPDLTRARWSGRLKPASPDYLQTLLHDLHAASENWGYTPNVEAFFQKYQQHAGGNRSLSSALASAQHAADQDLGLKHQVLVASEFLRANGYLLFVYDICARADEYAQRYNTALTEFRAANGISSPGRPMPDLQIETDFCEVPFWIDDLTDGSRKRGRLVRQDGAWQLTLHDAEFRFEPGGADGWAMAERLASFLTHTRTRIAPRALTLTSFLRLAVVDQFVHGIGGAIYDQVTNRILAACYDLQPPAFSVATATMYLPQTAGRERTCLVCISREGRTLRHGLLGERKQQLVKQIASAPRYSNERAMLFSQMHRELDEAMTHDPRVIEYGERYQAARQQFELDQVLFDRELPYTLQSRDRLQAMIAQVQTAFA